MMKLISLALAEIKLVYYPGEERLVSLDVLKLYRGEDVIGQNPKHRDPDQWVDEGELTELPKITIEEAEVRVEDQAEDSEAPEVDTGPELDIPIVPEDPEVLAEREGIQERIQVEIQHEDKEAENIAEEILKAPPVWNEVPDLMMEVEEGRIMPEAAVKQRRDEVAQGRREEDIRQEKRENSPTVS